MRILFLTHRLPYAPNRGDRIRSFHMLRSLSRFAEIDLVSLVHDHDEAGRASLLRDMVATVRTVPTSLSRSLARAPRALISGSPLTHVLLDGPRLRHEIEAAYSQRPPDVVLAYCSGIAPAAMAPPLDRVPWVLDLVDVDSQKWQEMADRGRFPMNLVHGREARTLRAFESRALLSARAGLVINEREARLARAIAPQAAIEIVSNGVDVEGFRRPDDTAGSAANVVFCGVMNYSPNEEGVLWFVREVWPAVRRARPDATLTLVGANPTDRIKAAAAHDRGILVTGSVGDVRSALWRAAVAIAPIHVARGMQNKVLEAIAASLPVAVTPAVAEGLPSSVLPACVVAATEPDFAQAVLALLDMPEEARRARAARAPIATLSWDAALTPLRAILERAADGEQALSES